MGFVNKEDSQKSNPCLNNTQHKKNDSGALKSTLSVKIEGFMSHGWIWRNWALNAIDCNCRNPMIDLSSSWPFLIALNRLKCPLRSWDKFKSSGGSLNVILTAIITDWHFLLLFNPSHSPTAMANYSHWNSSQKYQANSLPPNKREAKNLIPLRVKKIAQNQNYFFAGYVVCRAELLKNNVMSLFSSTTNTRDREEAFWLMAKNINFILMPSGPDSICSFFSDVVYFFLWKLLKLAPRLIY